MEENFLSKPKKMQPEKSLDKLGWVLLGPLQYIRE